MTKNKQTEKPIPEFTPAPNSIPEIQICLQEVRDFINENYAHYLKQDKDGTYPMCPEIHLFRSDEKRIKREIEALLMTEYYKQKGEANKATSEGTTDNELLYFLKRKMHESTTYKNIEKKLDKRFYSFPEPLDD
jgi:hypothetical protein